MASIDNTGGLWRNKKRNHPKSPDYIGQITIEGVTYFISAWKTDGSGKKPAVSIKVNQKDLNAEVQPQKKQYDNPPKEFDDDIPF